MSNASFDSPSPPPFTPAGAAPPTAQSYYFLIGSPDAFERQLQQAQDELGIPSHERIPVQYKDENSKLDWLIDLAPTLLISGILLWSMSKSGAMGGGKGGPGGIFGVGKSKAKMFK